MVSTGNCDKLCMFVCYWNVTFRAHINFEGVEGTNILWPGGVANFFTGWAIKIIFGLGYVAKTFWVGGKKYWGRKYSLHEMQYDESFSLLDIYQIVFVYNCSRIVHLFFNIWITISSILTACLSRFLCNVKPFQFSSRKVFYFLLLSNIP